MHYLKNFMICLLLATTPSTLAYPQDTSSYAALQAQQTNDEEFRTEHNPTLSYDNILNLLDTIESDAPEPSSLEELETIKHFIAFLAQEGALPDDSLESVSLEEDIENLLYGEDSYYEYAVAFMHSCEYQFMLVPTIFYDTAEVMLCKSWLKKQWKHIKKFAKKHKKALIVGAAVVVATAVIVVAVATTVSMTGAAVTSAAGAIGATTNSNKSDKATHQDASVSAVIPSEASPAQTTSHEAPSLKAAIDGQVATFKETVVENQLFTFDNTTDKSQLSWEDNGRALGSLLAHDACNTLLKQLPYDQKLLQEVNVINSKYNFHSSETSNDLSIGHTEIDRMFSTDYTYLYLIPDQNVDFSNLSYQTRGAKALEYGYYHQAAQDFKKAIETNPTNPTVYLEKGVAHFGLGEYERSLEEYRQFTAHTQKTLPLSVPAFSLGFAKGIPQGVYESGEGLIRFISDLVTHPIHAGEQMWEALSLLSDLARAEDWSALSQVLAPEVHHLIKNWDTLPSNEKGELAGYAFGKYGADIILPGACAKAFNKNIKRAQELGSLHKKLQTAEKTLVLESVSCAESGLQASEIIRFKTTTIAEKLGFNAREITQLENIFKTEGSITNHTLSTSNDLHFSNHALQRAIERGVARESIAEALASPLKVEDLRIDHLGRPSQRFIGSKAEVVINPETQQIVSVNPTSTKKFEKLNQELGNVKNKAE